MERIERAADVVRVDVAGRVEPSSAWALLAAEHDHLVWSDRSTAPDDAVSFIGLPRSAADVLPWSGTGPGALEALCSTLRERLPAVRSRRLGWWGWIGYELGAAAAGVETAPSDEPAAAFLLTLRGVEFDHAAGRATVLALAADRPWAEATAARLSGLRPSPVLEAPRAAAAWRLEREDYLDRIAACLDAIRRGDAYQLCLTDRVTVRADRPYVDGDVLRRLRATDRSEHAGVLRFGDRSLVSASPERFLRVELDGRASTRPIKGTRPRGSDAEEDRRLAEELRTDEKERAENLMIVDLMRNDLSRVSEVGSVEVERLFEVERLASVHHLVSTVASRLTGDAISAIAALFPAGSMTGAPKRSAMQHLARLEGGPRGAYSGAWGRIAGDGSLDLAVVIRSALLHGDTAVVGAGGGITALSRPEAEWDEVRLKAAPMLRALGAATD
ncbi:anthranilate synthase component I family protein [Amnibacterium kyonggiense]|uniref:Anthranilate synthase component 1/para-aminobenzoate synthetase n=1 Tax=Amnibacterium kyonggiense TaxID=595671 RepID=A0A4R7FPF7_9MICO|nr:anthranilate synthase component I family protein [Amnibacterium kyonggiense]TDS79625.1 anthranilate synthase component 1/para-aminobenzoate synthetase [Amnibacterium kyonggiense]